MPMRRGTDGLYIACKHCNREFESLGLRCCSADCDKACREAQERRAVLKEGGIEPTSRRMCECPGCDRPIPKWKNGPQVSAKVRSCSDLCRKRVREGGIKPFSDLRGKSTKSGTSCVESSLKRGNRLMTHADIVRVTSKNK